MSIHRSENVRNANKECGISVWKQVMERERLIERERERVKKMNNMRGTDGGRGRYRVS